MLKMVKSRYILKYIFDNITERRTLSVIIHNKRLLEKLDISEAEFRKFTRIEIDIQLSKEQKANNLQFLNINEDKKYYHIYLDNKEDISKRNYVKSNENIQKISVVLEMEIKSLKGLFENCKSIESINFIKFNRNDIIDMNSMFSNCTELCDINLSLLKTKNVRDMSYMFYNCSSLYNLDISNFNTSNVIFMNNMFSWCGNIENLELKNFNTQKVVNMNEMFYNCFSLKYLDISNFNFDKVANMCKMFLGCELLEDLKINLNIDKNIKIDGLFSDCSDELKNKIKNEYQDIQEEAFTMNHI